MAQGATGRGVYGEASGPTGRGVYGIATYTGSGTNYGGEFISQSLKGIAVRAQATGNYSKGILAIGSETGVHSSGTGWDFWAAGPGTDYGSPSSIRWKQNIQEIEGALEKVLQMRGVYFDWDEEHGGNMSLK